MDMSYAIDLTKGMNEMKRNDLPKESRVILIHTSLCYSYVTAVI